jgi:hypothetical protein
MASKSFFKSRHMLKNTCHVGMRPNNILDVILPKSTTEAEAEAEAEAAEEAEQKQKQKQTRNDKTKPARKILW